MADLLIQFHAHPCEIIQFAKDAAQANSLHLCMVTYFPYDVSEVLPETLNRSIEQHGFPDRIMLTIAPPVVSVSGNMQLLDRNPGCLVINIGSLSEKGLKESSMSSRTSSLTLHATWKKIAKQLKKQTRSGAIAVNPATGDSSFARSHRYSSGAVKLEQQGVPMLALGGNVYRLTIPNQEPPDEK